MSSTPAHTFVPPDEIRARFSSAMSEMYRDEVPQYGTLIEPVGYYDLSVAGVPVHSTAFRPVSDAALLANPFRVFTSLLRLDLIADEALRAQAAAILARRAIFTERALALIAQAEAAGGLADAEADEFVREALETFRWHSESTVDGATYDALHKAHRLIADVVCFKGPHRRRPGRHARARHGRQGRGRRPAAPRLPHPAAPDQLQGAQGNGAL
jgi:uncharacterized glyoxalase superfamily metalloenzyme YdcJ